MKKLASIILLALTACGGGDKVPVPVDSTSDAAALACNPVTQDGCSSTEKCTWIIDQVLPRIGHIGCAPVTGDEIAIGGECLDATDPGGPPPGPNGFDKCVKGAVCVAHLCETICDPQMQGIASNCDANHTCGRYVSVLEASGSIVAGACDANCNVFDQTRFDGEAACGSPVASAPIRGCYPNPFFNKNAADGTSGSCAPVRSDDFVPIDPNDTQNLDGIKHLDRTDRVAPRLAPSGATIKNGCAPGFRPAYFEGTGSMKALCTGICAPDPAGINTDTVAAKPSREFGDDTVPVKLPRNETAVAGDGLCQFGKKGSAEPENCVFAWAHAIGTDGMVDPMQGMEEGEEFGYCFPRNVFIFNNGTADVAYPNLKDLPPRSASTTGVFPEDPDDACDFAASPVRASGCKRSEAMLFQAPQVPHKQSVWFDNEAPAAAY